MKKFFNLKKIFLLFLIFVGIYFFSSKGTTPYNYFVRLADAFLHGRLYLTQAPSWLSELIPLGNNKWFVVYPPMPAIVFMPFVFFFGVNFGQQILAHIVGATIVIATYLTYKKRGTNVSLWASLLVGVGSIIWFMSSDGSVWFLGQLFACMFLSLSLLETQYKNRPLVVGLLVGAAYLSRVNTALSIPLFMFMLFNKKNYLKRYLLFGVGLIPFFAFNAIYNYLRFGVPWDMGYFLLPKILNETNAPWFAHGVMNPLYIPDNIKTALWTFPKRISNYPYLIPSWYGLSIWITTPAFIFSLLAPITKNINKVIWATVIIMFLFVAMHGGTGWAQFGYRFAVDFYPFLVYLTIEGVTRKKLNKLHWFILILGIIVNLWGVIWINKMGWVSF